MATFSELKPHHRVFVSNYPFNRFAVKDNPAARIQKPLNECRFALVTTGGILRPGDEPFRNTLKLGDTSYREIPNDVEVHNLIEGHKSTAAEHTGIERDINLAFPIERFREMEKEGAIGPLNHRHFSFMGSIISPRGLIKTTAPQVAGMLKEDRVDAVFLTPV